MMQDVDSPRLKSLRGYMFGDALLISLTNPAQPDYVEQITQQFY